MQRSMYANPAPAQSPPLHHPVPQHVSSVPQFRSPPPPSQSQNGYGYGGQQQQQQQGGAGFGQPNFGNFINDQTAQMGFQMLKNMAPGQEYMEQNFNKWVNVSVLKRYFNVSNSYVVNKLFIVLFPWRHYPWSRVQAISPTGQEGYYLPPREDINSPDMYIPVMALVTYILLSTVIAGVQGQFHPELLGLTATTAFAIVILELITLKGGTYFLGITSESQLLDLIAYSGYKFVGIIITIVLGEIGNQGGGTGGWIGWTVFAYTFLALAFFLLRSMKYVLLPDSTGAGGRNETRTVPRSERNKRTQFLFAYSFIVQLIFMWILTRVETPSMKVKS